ncbi:MAG: hypothetical protein AAGA34_13605 [Pseudomonadota bacterium]
MTNKTYRFVALSLAGVVLAVLLALQALSGMATRSRPEAAVALNGLNGLAREQLAARAFGEAATAPELIQAAALKSRDTAMAAYRSDPLVPKALMIAALSAPDEASKERILAAATQLNRRDLSLQGLVMEQRLERADYDGTVATLDQILRVHPEYSSEFFPILQEALVAPGSQAAFEAMLDGSSSWHERFLANAVRSDEARVALAAIRPAIAVSDSDFDRRLIGGLAQQGEFQLAQSVYDFLGAGEDGQGNDLGTTLAWEGQYPPFDWEFVSERDIRAQESLDASTLELFVRPGQGGVVARRYIAALDQGCGLATSLDVSRTLLAGRVRLSVFCSASVEPFASFDLAKGANTLAIPAAPEDCVSWRLEVYARTFRDEPTLRGDLDPLELVVLSPALSEPQAPPADANP